MRPDIQLLIIFMLKERSFKFENKFEDLSSEEKSRIFNLIVGINSKEEQKSKGKALQKNMAQSVGRHKLNGSR